jgi:hypothetical protein
MKWLAYLVLVLVVVAMGVSGYRLGRAHERDWEEERPPDPAQASAPPAVVGQAPTREGRPPAPADGKITVEADGLPPEAKQALADHFRKVLAEAFAEVIQKGMEEVQRKLRIADDLERKLWAAADCRDRLEGEPQPDLDESWVWAVHLIRPGPPDRPAETIDVTGDKPMTLRWTRAFASVERPLAVVTFTWTHGGRLRQREKVLVYGPDNEWHVAEPAGAPDRGGKK